MFKSVDITYVFLFVFFSFGVLSIFFLIMHSSNPNSKLDIKDKMTLFNENKPFICNEHNIIKKSDGFDLFYQKRNNNINQNIIYVKSDKALYTFLWCKPFKNDSFIQISK